MLYIENMIDLKKYFKIIGLEAPEPELSLKFLSMLVSSHLQAFRYQNTYLYREGKKPTDKRVSGGISLDAVYKLFVEQRQGGYCFQNTELLFGVLVQLGFNVERHLARVYNQPIATIDFKQADLKAFDHVVLIIRIDGADYIIDTGFANNSLREPLALEPGEQKLGPNKYRISQQGENWLLEMHIKDDQWLCLYKVVGASCSQEKVVSANEQLFKSPDNIPIRDGFNKIACITTEKRKFLVRFNDGTMFFKSFKAGRLYREKILESEESFNELAERKFSVNLGQ